MNDEEEGSREVMLESHQQGPLETELGIEQVKRIEQFDALEAEIREEGREASDSSLFGESTAEVIVGVEVPAVRDESIVGNEIEGEDKAPLLVAPAESEDVLIGGVKVSVAENIEHGDSSMAGGKYEKVDGVGEETENIKVEEKESKIDEIHAEAEEEKEVAVKEVDAGEEGREDGDREAQKETDLENEVEREKEVLPVTVAEDVSIAAAENVIAVQKHVDGEDQNLDGEREAQKDKMQNDVVGTAKVDEKMGEGREREEEDNSQLNADGLLPVTLQDTKMVEVGKSNASDTEDKVVNNNELELKEDIDRMEVEEQMEIKMEERQREAEEDVNKASPIGEKATEENHVDVGIKLGEKEEALEVKEFCSVGEEEKLDGAEKKDDESNIRGETEEAGGSQLNAVGLSPVILQDVETLEENSEGMEEVKMEEDEKEEAPQSGSGKRKRGRNSKSAGKAQPKKIVEEDVCFICLDGGDLVLCDRRGCPKAYHPSCVDRDESFFQSKGRWDCGWHLCRQCKKNAYYMCYTCQCSLCKGCLTDDASFYCVRGSKGLCQTCMKSVMLIENNEGNAQMATFDDKSSMDYLFKDYWTEQKENLSLTSDEIAMLIRQWKRFNADPNQEMPTEANVRNTEGAVISDSSLGNTEPTNSVRKKSKKKIMSSTVELDYDADGSTGKAEITGVKKRGRRNLKSQTEGSDLNSDNSKRKKAKRVSDSHAFVSEWASKELLEFIAQEKNGDKSALSQFDVQELLLQYVKRNKLRDPRQSGQIVCDTMLQKLFGKPRVGHIEMLKLLESHFLSVEDSQGDDIQGSVLDDENTDSFTDVGKSKGKKGRKRGYSKGLQSNLDDYAAIDMHNIKLIYLRRNLIEALLEDMESFHVKVVGCFVRIRIIGSSQKQELHRLVQVIGTLKAPEPYKVGKRTADCMLEILNLHKKEVIPMDAISNQDFDEDECKRLRQSIKCGFLSRPTVGDVLDKAKDIHVVRVTDWLETEITRHIHLRDRASDLGRKKQLRECVEKLQLLNSPEERQRRLDEVPLVHADPNMDPNYISEDESESDKGGDIWRRDTWRDREHHSSRRGSDSPSAARSPSKKWEPTRSFSSRSGDSVVAEQALNGKPWSPAGNKVSPQPTTPPSELVTVNQAKVVSETPVVENEVKINETEKSWHYRDPTGKVQGPFSVAQLRKWNKSGYFPATLKIWKATQTENDSIFLSEALSGKEPIKAVETPSQQLPRGQVISTVKIDQNLLSPTVQRSQTDPRLSSNESQNRPTSSQSVGSSASGRTRVSRWSGSPTPVVQLPSTVALTQQSVSQSTHHTLQVVTGNTATVSTNSSAVPAVSAYGVLNHNLSNINPVYTQGQQQQQAVYSNWQNTAVNNLPPPPPPTYSSEQTTSAATLPAQNLSGLPLQAQWTSQIAAMQQNQGVATTQIPGNAEWAQMMQAYINMGWVAPTGPFPYAQYGSQPGTIPSPALGMQPGNMNPAGWATPVGPWNWQQAQAQAQVQAQGQGMVAPGTQMIPKGEKACPYLMQGHCKKGAACDFRHS